VIALVDVPGPYALEPGDLLGFLVIRGPLDMSLVRPCGAQDPLELQAGDHIGVAGVSIRLVERGIERLESRSQNHRADPKGELLLLVVEVHRAGGAELLTGSALPFLKIDAVIRVDEILERDGLCVMDINGFPLHETFVVFTAHLLRAFLRAGSAGDTLERIHETGTFEDLDLEVPLFSAQIHHLTEREEFDVKMPADLDQFRGKDSHGAIIGGEGLVQLRHDPSNRGRFLHQIDVVSRVCKVKG